MNEDSSATRDLNLEPLVEGGYDLIPLQPRGKAPAERDWRTTQYSEEQILRWRARGGNVGVRLRPDDLVIDWDPRNWRDEDGDVFEKLKADTGLDLATFPRVATGSGGSHWYARMPRECPVRNQLKDRYGEGLEFKSVGRQVVAPGSIHPSGGPYEWGTRLDGEPPVVPEALVDLIERKRPKGRTGPARLPVRQVLMCLDQLDPCADPYDSHDGWFELMQAVHFASGGDQEAKEAFVAWSGENPAYAADSEQVEYRWDTLDADFEGGVGVGTLFKHVSDAGGSPYLPASMVFDAIVPPEEVAEQRAVAVASERPVLQKDSKTGRPLPSRMNACAAMRILELDPMLDRFSGQLALTGSGYAELEKRFPGIAGSRVWSDDLALAVETYFITELDLNLASTDSVHKAARMVGLNRAFNSLHDHLDSLEWDGVERLNAWIPRYCARVEPTPYVRAVGRIMVMGAVARAYSPGVDFQLMPILEGPQGAGKSTLLKILGNWHWYKDGLPAPIKDHADKEMTLGLQGQWIVEVPELASFRRAEVEALKAFVSRSVDRVRRPYGRSFEDVPRTFALVGTTNEHEYLTDATGGRRFLPVRVGRVDLALLAQERDALLAEAVLRWKEDPDPAVLAFPPGLWAEAAQQQAARTVEDPAADKVAEWLDRYGLDVVSAREVLEGPLGVKLGDDRVPQLSGRRVAKIMQGLGWEKKPSAYHPRLRRTVSSAYVRPDAAGA